MKFYKNNLKAYTNFLLSKYEMIKGETLVKSYPYYMIIDPSSICQLRCPLCPTGVENESRRNKQPINFRKRTMMNIDFYNALIDEVGEYLFLIMFYNWGEPLLNKELPFFISRAKKENICTEIHTNLSLRIDDKYMEDLLLSGIDIIAASIDGFTSKSYQTYRRGGNIELVKENIRRLALMRDRLGLKTDIIWNFLVFSFNEHEINRIKEYCTEIGVEFNHREAFVSDPEWLPSYRKDEAEKILSSSKIQNDQKIHGIEFRNKGIRCSWHYSYSVINADGSVSPCCAPWEQIYDFGVLKPGNINFMDIWNNNNFRKSRGIFAGMEISGLEQVNTLCLKCPFDKNIQNLYSYLDLFVYEQFKHTDFRNDILLQECFVKLEKGYKDDFVEYYQKYMGILINKSSIKYPGIINKLLRSIRFIIVLFFHPRQLYIEIKQMAKPYSRKIFEKYPNLYYIGKKIERWFNVRNNNC